MKVIKAKKITKKNFSKFGQLIDTSKKNPININDGYAKRFDNLINVDASKNKGKAIVSIFKAKKKKVSYENRYDGKTSFRKPSLYTNGKYKIFSICSTKRR